MARPTPKQFPFKDDSGIAAEAGKKSKRGPELKRVIREIINAKMPPELYERMKQRLGIPENCPQGEAAARSIMCNVVEFGDYNGLAQMAKLADLYKEEPLDISINVKFNDE